MLLADYRGLLTQACRAISRKLVGEIYFTHRRYARENNITRYSGWDVQTHIGASGLPSAWRWADAVRVLTALCGVELVTAATLRAERAT